MLPLSPDLWFVQPLLDKLSTGVFSSGLGNRYSRLFGNGNTRDSADNSELLEHHQDHNLMLRS